MRESSDDVEALAAQLAALFGEGAKAPKRKLPSFSDPPDGLSRGELEREFYAAMVDLYKRCVSETGYVPSRFAQMIANKGGVETARYLINAPNVSEGYMTLWEKRRLDLSVEFVAASPRYRDLFTRSEVRQAIRRLQDWGMDPEEFY
jgi:hypothetical protein